MTKIFLLLLPIIPLLCGCGDKDVSVGGGGVPVNATAPVLYNVFLSPSTVMQGSRTPIVVTLDYIDPGGDLNGGVITFIVDGATYSRLLSGLSNATTRTTAPGFTITIDSPAVGAIPIKFLVKDRLGFSSNDKIVSLIQTPSPQPAKGPSS